MSKYRQAIRFNGIDTDERAGDVCVNECIDSEPDSGASLAMTAVALRRAARSVAAKRRLPVLTLILLALLLPFLTRCANPAGGGVAGGRFTFAVADVGQGLAQFGVVGKRAVALDVGKDYAAWRGAYVNR